VAEVGTTPSFTVRARRPLFRASNYFTNAWHARYEVMPDDQSFIMIQTGRGAEGMETVVVRNWLAELEAD